MSFDAARPWIERFPHATSDVVTGGHLPWLDDAAAVGSMIEAFLLSRDHDLATAA